MSGTTGDTFAKSARTIQQQQCLALRQKPTAKQRKAKPLDEGEKQETEGEDFHCEDEMESEKWKMIYREKVKAQ